MNEPMDWVSMFHQFVLDGIKKQDVILAKTPMSKRLAYPESVCMLAQMDALYDKIAYVRGDDGGIVSK